MPRFIEHEAGSHAKKVAKRFVVKGVFSEAGERVLRVGHAIEAVKLSGRPAWEILRGHMHWKELIKTPTDILEAYIERDEVPVVNYQWPDRQTRPTTLADWQSLHDRKEVLEEIQASNNKHIRILPEVASWIHTTNQGIRRVTYKGEDALRVEVRTQAIQQKMADVERLRQLTKEVLDGYTIRATVRAAEHYYEDSAHFDHGTLREILAGTAEVVGTALTIKSFGLFSVFAGGFAEGVVRRTVGTPIVLEDDQGKPHIVTVRSIPDYSKAQQLLIAHVQHMFDQTTNKPLTLPKRLKSKKDIIDGLTDALMALDSEYSLIYPGNRNVTNPGYVKRMRSRSFFNTLDMELPQA